MREIIFTVLEFAAKLLCGPPCFLLVRFGCIFDSYWSIVSATIQTSSLVKAYPQRNVKKFCPALNMVFLFTEIYWSLHG
jgi:hypothetical protein